MQIQHLNKEVKSPSGYANAIVATANRNIGIHRLGISLSLRDQLMSGIGRVAMISIAATLALERKFSAGMLIAFIAYADQFTSRAASLIDKWVDFSMLKLHAERVADVALSAPETLAPTAWSASFPTPASNCATSVSAMRTASRGSFAIAICGWRPANRWRPAPS